MWLPQGLEFNYGQKLDQFVHTIQEFGFSFDGFINFKNQKLGKKIKTIAVTKGLKGYGFFTLEEIQFLKKLARGMFFNLEIYTYDKQTVYFCKSNL